MFTKTTIAAIRLLLYVGCNPGAAPASLRRAAEQLGESPSYLAKVSRHLVRAGVLRASRGVAGGVALNDAPARITLLAVLEACQGHICGEFCDDMPALAQTCAFHQASAELHQETIRILSSWTLTDLLRRPRPTRSRPGKATCWMQARQRSQRAIREA
jgi:Rrf2 family protein